MKDNIAGMFHRFRGEVLLDSIWIKHVPFILLASRDIMEGRLTADMRPHESFLSLRVLKRDSGMKRR